MVFSSLPWHPEYNALLVTSLTYFLCAVEFSILHVGEWPYMHEIDEEATSSFFGLASSLSKAAHAIAALFFALMAHKMGDIKPALLTGRVVTLIGCVLYLSIEFFPNDKRFVQLTAYILFGIGFSTSPLLRALASHQSSLPNRATAFAFLHSAQLLSILTGAVVQLSFSGLPYPGIEIFPDLMVHIYTVPIWLALFTNICVIFVIIFKLDVRKKDVEVCPVSLSWFRREFAQLRKQNLPWLLIVVAILERCITGTFIAALPVLSGPIMSAIYGKTGQETVIVKATMQICQGIMATLISFIFVVANVGKIISTRLLFLCATVIITGAAILILPYPHVNSAIAVFNETTRTGCDPDEYTWCFENTATPFYLYVISVAATLGLAVPCAFLSVDTIYSRLLGDIDQSVMQSVLVILDDMSDVVFRLAASTAFTAFGFGSVAIGIGASYLSGLSMWLLVWTKIKPYV